MNLLNREQLASLWVGIIGISLMGLMPPWREATGNGNPLIYAPISQPPISLSGLGVTIDYSRLSVQWLIAVFITGGLIASFHKVQAGVSPSSDKHEPAGSSGQAASGLKAERDQAQAGLHERRGNETQHGSSGSGIVENKAREKSSVSGRTLTFPKETIGDLLIESDEDPDYWEFYSQASGTVSIPTGKRLQFELLKNAEPRLAPLKSLPADAFYSLDFSGSRLSDSDLENIGHLAGLRELDLSDTSVSDLGIKSLSGLPNLQKLWLDNTGVTDKGLEELSNHRELAKISLIGTQLNGPSVQSLVKSFPQKCELVLEDNG